MRITAGDSLVTDVNVTAQLFYCLRGRGWSEFGANEGTARIRWSDRDFITLPAPADKPCFRPTVFPKGAGR